MQTVTTKGLAAAVALALGCAGEARLKEVGQKNMPQSAFQAVDEVVTPDNVERVPPKIVRRRVQAGKALLVYAYDNDENFKLSKLKGAIPFSEFRRLLPMLPMDEEIYFYCG